METTKPIFAGDFEESLFAPISRLKENVPRLSTNAGLAGGGVVFDHSVQRFVLHGTTIASFFVDKGRAAIVVTDGKVSESPLLQAASLEFQKMVDIDRNTVMAVSGSAGFAMLYTRMLKNWVETTERIREERLSVRSKVNMLSRILRENLPLALSGLMVIPLLITCDDKRGPRIFAFTPDGSNIEKKTYAISGSGKVNEGGLLLGWNRSMTRENGISLAKDLVKNASKLDSATGGKIFIKVISQDGIESIDGGWTNE